MTTDLVLLVSNSNVHSYSLSEALASVTWQLFLGDERGGAGDLDIEVRVSDSGARTITVRRARRT